MHSLPRILLLRLRGRRGDHAGPLQMRRVHWMTGVQWRMTRVSFGYPIIPVIPGLDRFDLGPQAPFIMHMRVSTGLGLDRAPVQQQSKQGDSDETKRNGPWSARPGGLQRVAFALRQNDLSAYLCLQ